MSVKHICEACGVERDITDVAAEWREDGFTRVCPDCRKIELEARMEARELASKHFEEQLTRILSVKRAGLIKFHAGTH